LSDIAWFRQSSFFVTLMLKPKTVQHLAAMPYRADAEWLVNILPFGGVYWSDEMPDPKEMIFFNPNDQAVILRMFSIRVKLWDQTALSFDEREEWDCVRSQVPSWPLFQRLELSEAQRIERARAQMQMEQEFERLDEDGPNPNNF
jgi:hypothetical protein